MEIQCVLCHGSWVKKNTFLSLFFGPIFSHEKNKCHLSEAEATESCVFKINAAIEQSNYDGAESERDALSFGEDFSAPYF